MVKMLIEIPDELNTSIGKLKLDLGHSRKQETIIWLLEKAFKDALLFWKDK